MKAQSVRTARGKLRRAVSGLMGRCEAEGFFDGWRATKKDDDGVLYQRSVGYSRANSSQLEDVERAIAAFAAAVRREERTR